MGVTVEDFQRITARDMREKVLQEQVRQICERLGHEYYHTHRSQNSPAGFPDCTIIAADRLIFAELKRQKEQPTKDQRRWLDALARCRCRSCGASAAADVYVWRPSDLLGETIAEILRP